MVHRPVPGLPGYHSGADSAGCQEEPARGRRVIYRDLGRAQGCPTQGILRHEHGRQRMSRQLPPISGRELMRALQRAGFVVMRQRGSHVSLVVEPLCDDAEGKKRNGYYYTSGRFLADLSAPEVVGLEAARRTVAKLGARKISTCQVPAIFSPEAGRSLLGQFAGVISGGSVWRKSTYLADREGSMVASPLVSIVDDPLIRRAPGSRPFDGEGLPVQPNVVVDRGTLRTFLCDVYAGRKLGRKSTGSAARSLGGGPHVSTSNFILAAGVTVPGDLEKVDRALYVTDLMGFGFNAVTGDFSQGAAGFWIEKGERIHPVSEVTLSVNFDALWKGIEAVGSDLDTRSSIRCPSFRVGSVTVAGN